MSKTEDNVLGPEAAMEHFDRFMKDLKLNIEDSVSHEFKRLTKGGESISKNEFDRIIFSAIVRWLG